MSPAETHSKARTAKSTNAAGLGPRPVLIGTLDALGQLVPALAAGTSPLRPCGCLLIEPDAALPPTVGDLPVLGRVDDLARVHQAQPFSAAIVSIPWGMPGATLRLRAQLRQLAIPERVVPTLTDLLEGATPAASRPTSGVTPTIDMVELIGRTPYGIDRKAVARVIEGKRVLVTGAGGSIGSEICRIAATFKPAQLIMVERSENALFEVDRQIARRFPDLPRKGVLHDVVDADGTLRHMVQFKPHTIFHAAAHKHVPLMEDHPGHAVTNNLFGTKSIADAAMAVQAERFVMISSDKAVNPSSVMGATKRMAEMYVQSCNRQASAGGRRTSFTMVRFGNVLGSACSVLPIWSAQLAEGGPITVTDPRMTRYFMTIHEAATLVIQAGAIDAHDTSRGPQPTIFVLDMGDPVRIVDLAHRFVALHGFEPRSALAPAPQGQDLPRLVGREIDIVFTGARPGEKLHEELAYLAEALLPTPYPGIMALEASAHAEFDAAAMIAELSSLRLSHDRAAVVEAIRRHVPEMLRPDTKQNATESIRPALAAG